MILSMTDRSLNRRIFWNVRAGGLVDVGQQVEDGGLTSAVGADEASDLVAADHQVEAVHGGQAAKVDAQFTDVEDGLFILVAVGQEAAGRDAV